TELELIDVGTTSDENDVNSLTPDVASEAAEGVFNKWKTAQSLVVNPSTPRTPPTRDSILRGRDLFLGRVKDAKLVCTDCHGVLARGDGRASSFRTCSTGWSSGAIPASDSSGSISSTTRRRTCGARSLTSGVIRCARPT